LISVPSTGGYQSWQTISAGQVQLTAGTHLFRIGMLIGGFNLNYVEFTEAPTSVEEPGVSPHHLLLEQNYPNPFNPLTIIRFTVPMNENAAVRVMNMLGQDVAVLYSGKAEAGKRYELIFDASSLPSGTYFVRLDADGQRLTKKILLVK
jgi:hypothetical protein